MTPWFLRDPERLSQERAGIEELLKRSSDWFIGAEWLIDGCICLDAVVRAHDRDYELRVSFPSLYPDALPVVHTRNMQSRVSTHQYGGANGTLCLEWGPDNWHRDVTAVQMIESAHRLLEIENPLGQDRPEQPVVAPSRHHLTAGQDIRSETARWYDSEPLREFIRTQPANSVGSFTVSFRLIEERRIALVHEAKSLGGEIWKDGKIPTVIPDAGPGYLYSGVWFKTNLEASTIGTPENLDAIRTLLANLDGARLLATDGTSPIAGLQRPLTGVLIIDNAGEPHLFLITSGIYVTKFSPVRSEMIATNSRAPDLVDLSNHSVGIVGLGSAGSKIAICLARMGVRNFYIVDHDLLLPENLQRHALDWQAVTQHKVDAVSIALRQIAADAKVEVCRWHLTGQESNAVVNGALARLGRCDFIVDATAEPRVFNLLAAVARAAARPMVWLEIFAGGIGGLIARSRPGLDPAPQDMRGAYLQYCTDNPNPMAGTVARNYALETADGEVLQASDADVSVIAHHAAAVISDCFLPKGQSRYPYSMYLVGLQKAWVFDAPFQTIPLSMASFPVYYPQPTKSADLGPDNVAFLLDLLAKQKNATASAT
jgi:molybdopterin/thiamine biosynthesis adenylyltransferase